jgi:RAD51-like protein 2
MAMQLSLNVQIPVQFNGCGGRSIYIDTEGSFMAERAEELAKELSSHLSRLSTLQISQLSQQSRVSTQVQENARLAASLTSDYFLDNLLLFRCHNQSELLAVLYKLKDYIVQNASNPSSQIPLKLIVIDSIAFHFRSHNVDIASRNRLLNQILQHLNQLAYEHQVAVVLINHVTMKLSKSSQIQSISYKDRIFTSGMPTRVRIYPTIE